MTLIPLVFSGGKGFPGSRNKSVKQLEMLGEGVHQGCPARFPLPACLCSLLQQNLGGAMVIAVIAIIHHELATSSSPCLRFSACSCSVPWTWSYLLTITSLSQQAKLKFPFSFSGLSVALPLLISLSCLLLCTKPGLLFSIGKTCLTLLFTCQSRKLLYLFPHPP